MKIGFDARLYFQTGVGTYIRNLVESLLSLEMDDEYTVFIRSKDARRINFKGRNVRIIQLDVPWHSMREQAVFPRLVSSLGIDLVHYPYFSIPVGTGIPYVVTIHDLIINHFDTGRASTLPLPLYKLKRLFYTYVMRTGVKNADHILTVSEATKREIMSHYSKDGEKITVTYNALDKSFQKERLKKYKHRNQKQYILYVGNAYPHKNLPLLLEAFNTLDKRFDLNLLLVGRIDYFYAQLQKYAQKLKRGKNIIFYGEAGIGELVHLYREAKILVSPSLMEGFGLPNIEAVSCNLLPVVSRIDAYTEIWGDILPTFDPKSMEEMKRVIEHSLTLNNVSYKKILDRASLRLKAFSWQKTAQQTRNVYDEVLNERRGPSA